MPTIQPYRDTKAPDSLVKWIESLRLELAKVPKFSKGNGSPEAVVNGKTGDQYTREDGALGTRQYIKTTLAGNTGWIAIG